jgi:hypothetical protein
MLQLRRALGPNSPELDTIKRSYMQQVMTPRMPTAVGEAATGAGDFARVATNIDEMLTGKGAEFSRRFLTNPERAAMTRYADVMRRAGQVAPEETASRLRMWGNVALATAPAVVGVAVNQLAEVDPKLAAVISAVGYIPGGYRAIKSTAPVQTYLANRPPANVGRPYRYPAGRTALPLAATAEPGLEENAKDAGMQLRQNFDLTPRARAFLGAREGRATGGAVNLMSLSKAAKKQVTQSTEALLNESDDTVARALEVANKHI